MGSGEKMLHLYPLILARSNHSPLEQVPGVCTARVESTLLDSLALHLGTLSGAAREMSVRCRGEHFTNTYLHNGTVNFVFFFCCMFVGLKYGCK